MEHIVSIFLGVIASLIATAIISLKFVQPFLQKTKDQISEIINPVSEFTDASEFIRLFNSALHSFDGDFSKLVLYRALPCEFSKAFFDNFATQVNSTDLIEYQNLINHIVKEGSGSFDKTVFGKTSINEIDSESARIIRRKPGQIYLLFIRTRFCIRGVCLASVDLSFPIIPTM